MTGRIKVEELNGGLRAAFIHMPHFRTSSARLTIHSGSLHEPEDTRGAAHFLEHITFQGTEGMPTEKDVHDYTEKKGLNRNAGTGQSSITYSADGFDLASTAFFVKQVVFAPTLSAASLERERPPIIDELRGYASSPYFRQGIEHAKALRGDRYSQPIGGNEEDVASMTHADLIAYHKRNFKLGNATLVICSSEPVEAQHECAQSFINDVRQESEVEPSPVDLPEFNPSGLTSSLQRTDLPLTAQTHVSINYGLPESQTIEDQFCYGTIGRTLAKAAHRRLRGELALCYDANAGTSRLTDLHFGADKLWSHVTASANVNGADSIAALDALSNDVFSKQMTPQGLEAVLLIMRRYADLVLQNNPASIADSVMDILKSERSEEIDMEIVNTFAQKISLEKLQSMQKEITDTKPLIVATSPDPAVLRAIGEWAAAR